MWKVALVLALAACNGDPLCDEMRFLDGDGDGYGGDVGASACEAPSGYVEEGGDCDDTRPDVSPLGVEVCDESSTDEDCDGLINGADGVATIAAYADADGDGFGTSTLVYVCAIGPGYSSESGDCDDLSFAVNPNGVETCTGTGIDEDCDGALDAADPSAIDVSWTYADADEDGHGSLDDDGIAGCGQVDGRVDAWDDCDDSNPAVFECPPGFFATPAITLAGYTPNGAGGTGVAAVGDLDGDGLTEIAIAAPRAPNRNDNLAGLVSVMVQPFAEGQTTLSGAWLELDGTQAEQQVGVLAPVGDLDNDGDIELAVASSFHDGSGTDSGAVWLWRGPVVPGLRPIDDTGSIVYLGQSGGDGAGIALAGGVDVSGEGAQDLLIATRRRSTSHAIYVLHAPTASISLSTVPDSLIGLDETRAAESSVYAADVDGDGVGDVVTSDYATATPTMATIHVVYGPIAGHIVLDPSTEDAFMEVETLQSSGLPVPGVSVSDAGDLDGDGLPDVLVGTFRAAGVFRTWSLAASGELDGAAPIGTFTADQTHPATEFKPVGAAVGDIDGDDEVDFVFGVQDERTTRDRTGAALVVYGPVVGTRSLGHPDLRLVGAGRGESTGASVAALGDIDGDGLADFAVGAPGSSVGATLAGAVFIVRAADLP